MSKGWTALGNERTCSYGRLRARMGKAKEFQLHSVTSHESHPESHLAMLPGVSPRGDLESRHGPQTNTSLPRQRLLLLFSRLVVFDSATPRTAARQASLSFTVSWSSLKLMSIGSAEADR